MQEWAKIRNSLGSWWRLRSCVVWVREAREMADEFESDGAEIVGGGKATGVEIAELLRSAANIVEEYNAHQN